MSPDNVQGTDSHALDTYYDISAVVPDGKTWTRDSLPPMLRQLLRDRFHLKVRPGTRQVSGYILVAAKGGPKLTPAKVAAAQGHKAGEPFSNSIFPGYIRGRGIDLGGIAAMLAPQAGGTVVDRTGIPGVFDVDLHFATGTDTESEWPILSVAVEQQLGLKLQPQKLTVNTLVVEHADSEPTPN